MCDNIIGTLFSIDEKTKDNLNSQLDLQALTIRNELHLIESKNKFILLATCYSLTLNEIKEFCKFLKSIKAPNSYSFNISHYVQLNERKIYDLKLPDGHVLMQQLLPLIVHGVPHKNVCGVIIELSKFFKQLCSKVLETNHLHQLENNIIVILCKMEQIFPPSFFDIMVHLLVHLVSKAKVARLVQYCWMYLIEQYCYNFI